jgi:rare lipoprotein A
MRSGIGDRQDTAAARRRRPAMTAGLIVAVGCVAVAGCTSTSSKKASIDPRYGVSPSPLVVGSGEPVPQGGGRYQVGKPYRIAGKWYTPMENPGNFEAMGVASWYGPGFHGRRTANGEVFDQHSLSAAHPTLPMPSYVRVTNLANGSSVIVRINDRGPYHGRRVIDVSRRVAEMLDFKARGMGRVRVQYVGLAPIEGDDAKVLAATFRDAASGPAPVPGTPAAEPRTLMIASKTPPTAGTSPTSARTTTSTATRASTPLLRSSERGVVRPAPTVARPVVAPAAAAPAAVSPGVSPEQTPVEEIRTIEIAGMLVTTPRARPQGAGSPAGIPADYATGVQVASLDPALSPALSANQPAVATTPQPAVMAAAAPVMEPLALGAEAPAGGAETALPPYGAAEVAAATLGPAPRLPVRNPNAPPPASIDDLLATPPPAAPVYAPSASFAPVGSTDATGLAIGRFVAPTRAGVPSGGAPLTR